MSIDKSIIYDYIIELPETPAFEDNIAAMMLMINEDGGTAPTLHVTSDEEGNRTQTAKPQVGTVPNSSRTLFHFRLRQRLEAIPLINYLESQMSGPIPPITVVGIQSGFPIINTETGTDPETGDPLPPIWDYEIIEPVLRTDVMNFFRIQDYDENGDPDGNPRPPQVGDVLGISKYAGGMDITV